MELKVSKDKDIEPNEARPATNSASPDRTGYKQPPQHTRFRPGQSGNPNGRPKRRRSIFTDLAAALDALDPRGTGKTIQQQIVQGLVDEAAAGKATALKVVLPMAVALDRDGGGEDAPAATELERRLIADFTSRLQSADADSAPGGSDE
jgi:hypothetical protein